MKIKKAIIPVAGLGTRFLPATKAQPKEMLPIVDKPTVQYIVEEAIQAGIENIIFITGRGKSAIEDHFDKSYELEATLFSRGQHELLKEVEKISSLASIYYVRQKEAKGLGNAVWSARDFIGEEPFAVMLGDDVVVSKKPCLKQMIEIYEKYMSPLVGITTVEKAEVSRYGIVAWDKTLEEGLYNITDLVEKPKETEAPSNMGIIGRYILTPDIFKILGSLKPGSGGEIQLTDAIREMNQSKRILGCCFEGKRYDVGEKLGFIKANIEFSLSRNDLAPDLKAYLKRLVQKDFYLP